MVLQYLMQQSRYILHHISSQLRKHWLDIAKLSNKQPQNPVSKCSFFDLTWAGLQVSELVRAQLIEVDVHRAIQLQEVHLTGLAPPGYRMARLRFASSVFNWGIKDKRAAATQIRLFCDNGRSCCLVCKMCPALCDPVDCSMPGFPVCPSLSPGVCLNSCPLSG